MVTFIIALKLLLIFNELVLLWYIDKYWRSML